MTRVPVLDHGYVEPITFWGSEEQIIESARMSTAKGFLGWDPEPESVCDTCGGDGKPDHLGRWLAGRRLGTRQREVPRPEDYVEANIPTVCRVCVGSGKRPAHPGDAKLLKYLWKNKHFTPFEFAGAVFEIKAPIFVFREWHRHRTQSYNEMSARYTPLPNENYIPSVDRLLRRGAGFESASKQAGIVKGADDLTEEAAADFQARLRSLYDDQESLYQVALRYGVPKELARVHLPVGRYSRMRASANLRNWVAFLTLRCAPDAQWEIRSFAEVARRLLAEKFPRTLELFDG